MEHPVQQPQKREFGWLTSSVLQIGAGTPRLSASTITRLPALDMLRNCYSRKRGGGIERHSTDGLRPTVLYSVGPVCHIFSSGLCALFFLLAYGLKELFPRRGCLQAMCPLGAVHLSGSHS